MRRILLFILVLLFAGLMLVSGQDRTANLHLIVDRDLSLVVYVSSTEPIALNGLALRVVTELGTFETRRLEENFDSLRLTNGMAQPGSCFVYVQSGTSPNLPQICSLPNQIYRRDVPRVDVFWFDFAVNRSRDIAIIANDVPTGAVCPWSSVDCPFTYTAPAPTPMPTVDITALTYTRNADWTPVSKTFDGVEMVLVPKGCFIMGSKDGGADEKPAHQQCFDTLFWIDRYEVTNRDYGSAGYFPGNDKPREKVDWFEAQNFCREREADLPTEREWEYAARGPDNLLYPWGNDFEAENVIFKEFALLTADVGQRPSGVSWVGALDMAGNVAEWTSSIKQPYPYNADDGRELTNNAESKQRIIRGGSWLNIPATLTTSSRQVNFPTYKGNTVGFRCARDFQPGDWP